MTRLGILAAALLMVGLMGAEARAWEPPTNVTVARALGTAELAFVGRVVRVQETQRKGTEAMGIATVALSMCLVGTRCQKESTIDVLFTAATIGRDETDPGGPADSADFALGKEYLFTFKKPGSGTRPRFWTEYATAFDVAFLVTAPSRRGANAGSDVLGFTNMYKLCPWPGQGEKIAIEQLRALAASRSASPRR
jgi:hypothetical protein